MWIDNNGNLYIGDCRIGDREATQEEVDNWEKQRSVVFVTSSPLEKLKIFLETNPDVAELINRG